MRKSVILGTAILMALGGCDKNNLEANSGTGGNATVDADDANLKPAPVAAVGRYAIIHSPHIQADTVLLDTATGRTWQLVRTGEAQDSPNAWQDLPISEGSHNPESDQN